MTVAADIMAVGKVFRGRDFTFTLARVLAFSGGSFDEPGWPQRNLHTDVEKAHEAGLTEIIASGTQCEGLLLGHLIDLFGDGWYDCGKLEAKIIKSVFVGDTLTPVAVVQEICVTEQETTIELEVCCQKQDNQRTLIGHASVCVPRPFKG